MAPQDPDGGRAQRARGEQLEDHWEASARPRGLDVVAGSVLREFEGVRAITEQRAVSLRGVGRGTGVERGKIGHELYRRLAFPAGEDIQVRQKVLIRQCGRGVEDAGLHARVCITAISALSAVPWEAAGAPMDRPVGSARELPHEDGRQGRGIAETGVLARASDEADRTS
jgi:hypothetical protein